MIGQLLARMTLLSMIVGILAIFSGAQTVEPCIIVQPLPKLPQNYGMLDVQVTTTFRVELLSSGTVGKVAMVSPERIRELDELALAAVHKLRFRPKEIDGSPVTTHGVIRYGYSWRFQGWRQISPETLKMCDSDPSDGPFIVDANAEGAYWIEVPKPWFTRLIVISADNRELMPNSHDDAQPTIPGYYAAKKESEPFTHYPFKAVQVGNGRATFSTKVVEGVHFVFIGISGTEFDEPSNIPDVPFIKGTLFTYRNGKLIKREKVKFGHAVNA